MLVKPICDPVVFEADNAGSPVGSLPISVPLSRVELVAALFMSVSTDDVLTDVTAMPADEVCSRAASSVVWEGMFAVHQMVARLARLSRDPFDRAYLDACVRRVDALLATATESAPVVARPALAAA